MHIYIGADHRGFGLKNELVGWLSALKYEFTDFGARELDPDDDYNDYAKPVVREVLAKPGEAIGVLLCGSAQGMCMQANRYKGIRAVFCRNAAEAAEARIHNDANVACIPADEPVDYAAIIDIFLKTGFLESEKYVRRNRKLDEE